MADKPSTTTSGVEDNRIASRPPFNASNLISNPIPRFKTTMAPTGLQRSVRNQNQTYADIQLSRLLAKRELDKANKIKIAARRPNFQIATEPLQKPCDSRGDFITDPISIPRNNETTEDDLQLLFRFPHPYFPKSTTNMYEGLPTSFYHAKSSGSTPKASASNYACRCPTNRGEVVRNRLCPNKTKTARVDTHKKDEVLTVKCVGAGGAATQVVPDPESVEYFEINRQFMDDEDSEDDDDSESEQMIDHCRICSANPFGDEVLELQIQHFDDVHVESESELEVSPPTILDSVCVPSSLILMEDQDAKNFTGRLEIENKTNFYFAFVLKTNLAGKHGYFATPGQGSIPPKSTRAVTISTTQAGYTQLLARHDRLIMAGVGLPRKLKPSYLSRYLKEMLEKYPSVGEKKIVTPILKELPEENAPPEKRFKNREQIYLNRLMCEISSTHAVIRDVAIKVRSHNVKENFFLLLLVLGMILVFVNQKQILSAWIQPNYQRVQIREENVKSSFLAKVASLF